MATSDHSPSRNLHSSRPSRSRSSSSLASSDEHRSDNDSSTSSSDSASTSSSDSGLSTSSSEDGFSSEDDEDHPSEQDPPNPTIEEMLHLEDRKLDDNFTPLQLETLLSLKEKYRHSAFRERREIAQSTAENFRNEIIRSGKNLSKTETSNLFDHVKIWFSQRARTRHEPVRYAVNWTSRQVFYKENTALVSSTQQTLYTAATGKKMPDVDSADVDFDLIGEDETDPFLDDKTPTPFYFFQRALTAEWRALTDEAREEYEEKAIQWRMEGPSDAARKELAEKDACHVIRSIAHDLYRQMGVRIFVLASYEDTNDELIAVSLDFNNELGSNGQSYKKGARSYLERIDLLSNYAAFVRKTAPGEDDAINRKSNPKEITFALVRRFMHFDWGTSSSAIAIALRPNPFRQARARGETMTRSNGPKWVNITKDLYQYIDREYLPENVELPLRDPGVYGLANCQALLNHWWDRQEKGLTAFRFNGYYQGGFRAREPGSDNEAAAKQDPDYVSEQENVIPSPPRKSRKKRKGKARKEQAPPVENPTMATPSPLQRKPKAESAQQPAPTGPSPQNPKPKPRPSKAADDISLRSPSTSTSRTLVSNTRAETPFPLGDFEGIFDDGNDSEEVTNPKRSMGKEVKTRQGERSLFHPGRCTLTRPIDYTALSPLPLESDGEGESLARATKGLTLETPVAPGVFDVEMVSADDRPHSSHRTWTKAEDGVKEKRRSELDNRKGKKERKREKEKRREKEAARDPPEKMGKRDKGKSGEQPKTKKNAEKDKDNGVEAASRAESEESTRKERKTSKGTRVSSQQGGDGETAKPSKADLGVGEARRSREGEGEKDKLKGVSPKEKNREGKKKGKADRDDKAVEPEVESAPEIAQEGNGNKREMQLRVKTTEQENEGDEDEGELEEVGDTDAAVRDRARFWAVMHEMFHDVNLFGGTVPTVSILDKDRYKDDAHRLECRRAEFFNAMPPIYHRAIVSADPLFEDEFGKRVGAYIRQFVMSLRRDTAATIFGHPKLANYYRYLAFSERGNVPEFKRKLQWPGLTGKKKMLLPIHYPDGESKGKPSNRLVFRCLWIAMVMRSFLFGRSTVEGGNMENPNWRLCGRPNGKKWKIKRITPGLLALAAVLVVFIHNIDKELDPIGLLSGFPYFEAFHFYKRIIVEALIAGGEKAKRVQELMEWHNGLVFPNNTGGLASKNIDSDGEEYNSGNEADEVMEDWDDSADIEGEDVWGDEDGHEAAEAPPDVEYESEGTSFANMRNEDDNEEDEDLADVVIVNHTKDLPMQTATKKKSRVIAAAAPPPPMPTIDDDDFEQGFVAVSTPPPKAKGKRSAASKSTPPPTIDMDDEEEEGYLAEAQPKPKGKRVAAAPSTLVAPVNDAAAIPAAAQKGRGKKAAPTKSSAPPTNDGGSLDADAPPAVTKKKSAPARQVVPPVNANNNGQAPQPLPNPKVTKAKAASKSKPTPPTQISEDQSDDVNLPPKKKLRKEPTQGTRKQPSRSKGTK
ncbi:hypothetical protein NMY22_g7127 [Coprinellus aureogranulatus]|nr:hypothetical protein NMY22_g7127 [Coprinellus aureogranulatus]